MRILLILYYIYEGITKLCWFSNVTWQINIAYILYIVSKIKFFLKKALFVLLKRRAVKITFWIIRLFNNLNIIHD